MQVLDSGAETSRATTSQPARVGCVRQVHCYDQTKSHTQNVFVIASTHAVSNEGLLLSAITGLAGKSYIYVVTQELIQKIFHRT